MKSFKQLTENQEWKKTVARNVRKLTPAQAKTHLADIEAERKAAGDTIFHPTIRKLTGGYNSQSINFHVIRKLYDKSKK